MPDAPDAAWTGRDLLTWLQEHPQFLDRPVHILEMAKDDDAGDANYLTLAETDQFDEDEPPVISLCAWPENPKPRPTRCGLGDTEETT